MRKPIEDLVNDLRLSVEDRWIDEILSALAEERSKTAVLEDWVNAYRQDVEPLNLESTQVAFDEASNEACEYLRDLVLDIVDSVQAARDNRS